MKIYSLIVYFFLAVGGSLLSAQNLQNYMSLEGTWKFSIGDDMTWAQGAYEDSEWEMVHVPSAWENQGFNGYDGYAWYRRSVTLPLEAKDEVLWIELGFIDDVDEVYFNGIRIGKTGAFPPFFETAYNARRLYRIPAHAIFYGKENQIAVRVYDAYNVGGIHAGNIGIRKERHPLVLDVNLEGQWKFRTGDHSVYASAEYNDQAWSDILVPGTWEDQGYRYYDGLAWYRRKVAIPASLRGESLVLIVGKIDDVDEVYVNGELIGQTGEIRAGYFQYDQAYKAQRGYLIPSQFLKDRSEISIAIRVYDDRLSGGIYEGPVGFITQEKYIKYWKSRRNYK